MADKAMTEGEAASKVQAALMRVASSKALLALGGRGNAVRAVVASALRAADATEKRING
tara:strand:+ start:424 stop:600 length:177 start_codon:yes stop_codon:yes gene_type:complete